MTLEERIRTENELLETEKFTNGKGDFILFNRENGRVVALLPEGEQTTVFIGFTEKLGNLAD